MNEVLIFFLGSMSGGMIAVMLLCLFRVNRKK